MEMLLIRHARPFPTADESGADPDLTPEGELQSKLLAGALAEGRYGTVDRLVSSPMRRALQTAGHVGEALVLGTVIEDRIAELDQGWTTYGLDLDAYDDRRELFEHMNDGRLGENTFDPHLFRTRVIDGLDAQVGTSSRVTAIVCHGGVINAYLSHILGTTRMFFAEPFYTSVTRLRVEPDGYRQVLSLNETDHLWGSAG